MLNDQRARSTNFEEDHNNHEQHESPVIRDIHALAPPRFLARAPPHRETWETSRSSSLSTGSTEGGENFTTMSREFNALVLAGSSVGPEHESNPSNLTRIGEDENLHEDNNPLAIVPDNNPIESPPNGGDTVAVSTASGDDQIASGVSVQRVKKDEVESKINAWQNAKIAKINNRFKREDAVINGWEGEQVQKASSWMKKIERKLEEKRAKAQEKMQNDIAKAHRKAEERRASAEAKRGLKVAKILEIANLMRVVGRAPGKRSFF